MEATNHQQYEESLGVHHLQKSQLSHDSGCRNPDSFHHYLKLQFLDYHLILIFINKHMLIYQKFIFQYFYSHFNITNSLCNSVYFMYFKRVIKESLESQRDLQHKDG